MIFSSFFTLSPQKGSNNSLEIMNLVLIMCLAFVIIYGVYEFGEKLTGTFEEINDAYDRFAWNVFPYDVQTMIPTLIVVAQKPIELRVFGSISCGRITFRNVGGTSIFHLKPNIKSKIWNRTQFNSFQFNVTTLTTPFRYAIKPTPTLWFCDGLKTEISYEVNTGGFRNYCLIEPSKMQLKIQLGHKV